MKTTTILLCISSLILGAHVASAETSPFRLQVASSSANDGLGEGKFELYERKAGVGRDARVQDLLSRFESPVDAVATGAFDSIQTGDNHVLVSGDGWLLDVRGDGDWVRYWNTEYATSPANTPVPLSARPSLSGLESIGREFIGAALGDLVDLAANEKLEPWYTAHQIEVTEELGGARQELVYASKIVFTRTIDGVPVLGPGSKVVVHVAADGTVTGFDVDWSRFEGLADTQTALALPDIRSRTETVAAEKASAASRVEDRFECGYYDTGARLANTAAPLQVACLSSYRVTYEGGAAAFVDAIPASKAVQTDAKWTESKRFASSEN
jgi:hypothetical protein